MFGRRWQFQYKAAPYVLILPFFLSFFLFSFIPLIFSFYTSMTRWNGFENREFVGLMNFQRLLADQLFWKTLWNSVIIFVLHVPLMLFLALTLAVLLNRPLMRAKGFYRTSIFLPNVINVVAIVFVFSLLFNKQDGLVNTLLLSAGFIQEPIGWLETEFWSRVSVALMVLYRWTGYNMILFLAGLQTIPRELYESAYVDGANGVQAFWRITLPNMRRIFLFCSVLSTIGTFALFTEPYVLTNGGPLYATMTPILYLYQEAFMNLNFGYASAIAVAFFFIMMLLTILQLRVFKD